MSDFRDGQFQKKYVDPVTELMNDFGVRHGLVATMDVDKVRHSNWLGRNPFVLVNVFEDPSHFKMFYDSGNELYEILVYTILVYAILVQLNDFHSVSRVGNVFVVAFVFTLTIIRQY